MPKQVSSFVHIVYVTLNYILNRKTSLFSDIFLKKRRNSNLKLTSGCKKGENGGCLFPNFSCHFAQNLRPFFYMLSFCTKNSFFLFFTTYFLLFPKISIILSRSHQKPLYFPCKKPLTARELRRALPPSRKHEGLRPPVKHVPPQAAPYNAIEP